LGALGVATPAWSWSAAGSVAGTGTGTAPSQAWDPEVDALVAAIIDRGDVPAANTALRQWTRNDQELAAGMPDDLRDFIETARVLPDWADQATLADGFAFNEKRGTYLGALYGLNSGMMSTAIPFEARAVYYSAGGADMKRRISRTSKLGYDIGTRNAFAPQGSMIVTAVKTRLVHSAVRHLLPQSSHWNNASGERIPISQADMMVTWHSLGTSVIRKLDQWGVRSPANELEGFLQTWQVSAYLLGIREEYIPASWAEADSQAKQVLDPILGATPEGIKLADILLGLGADADGELFSRPFLEAFTHFMLGNELCDELQIQRRPAIEASIRANWPGYVAMREAGLWFPLAPQIYWTFDEFLRQAALAYLSDGQPISIEIPDANNPHYS
jgi:hypothetical protein